MYYKYYPHSHCTSHLLIPTRHFPLPRLPSHPPPTRTMCSILRYIIVCPDGIIIVTWILCYLSEVVVLKLASAVLYLECRPLDMRTGAPDYAAGEYAAGRDSWRNIETVLPRTMSPRPGWAGGKKFSLYRAFERARRVCVCVRRNMWNHQYNEIRCLG